MVPGKPPRHSKSTEEPVTIDLDAQEFAGKTEADTTPETTSVEPESVTPPEEAPAEPAREAIEESVESQASQPEQPSQYTTTQPEPPVQHRAGAASGFIAAGIFGGLIALLGAGAIQYAGYLPGSSSQPVQTDQTADLSAEIDGLKQSVANLAAAPNPDDSDLDKRISALETAAKTPAASAAGDPAAAEALNQKIAELSAQLEQLRGSISQSSEQQASNGADIAKRLDEAEKKLSEPRQDVAVAKAIAAASLKAAIDRGGPFMAELDTFAGVAPDDPAAADLRSFAETGVPSRSELIRQVPDVATAIVESANQPGADQSWSDRLMASARSLVSVRPVGNIEGDSVEAIAARMEDKLKNGDLPGAANEWNALPPASKQASAAFKQSLEARIRVEELVGSALSKAVSGTGKES